MISESQKHKNDQCPGLVDKAFNGWCAYGVGDALSASNGALRSNKEAPGQNPRGGGPKNGPDQSSNIPPYPNKNNKRPQCLSITFCIIWIIILSFVTSAAIIFEGGRVEDAHFAGIMALLISFSTLIFVKYLGPKN